ncbi:MAG: hypothetical protein AABX96_00995 [Nanoarchaeota archaeon]
MRFSISLYLIILTLSLSIVSASVLEDFLSSITKKGIEPSPNINYDNFEFSNNELMTSPDTTQDSGGIQCKNVPFLCIKHIWVEGSPAENEDQARKNAILACRSNAGKLPGAYGNSLKECVAMNKIRCLAAKYQHKTIDCRPTGVIEKNTINPDSCKVTKCFETYVGAGEFNYVCEAEDGAFTKEVICEPKIQTSTTNLATNYDSSEIGLSPPESSVINENEGICIIENLNFQETSGVMLIKSIGNSQCKNKFIPIKVIEQDFFTDDIILEDYMHFDENSESKLWTNIEKRELEEKEREYYLYIGAQKSKLFYSSDDENDLLEKILEPKDYTGDEDSSESNLASLDNPQVNWEYSCQQDPSRLLREAMLACANKCLDQERLKQIAEKIAKQRANCMNACQREPSLNGRVNCERSCDMYAGADDIEVQLFLQDYHSCILKCIKDLKPCPIDPRWLEGMSLPNPFSRP